MMILCLLLQKYAKSQEKTDGAAVNVGASVIVLFSIDVVLLEILFYLLILIMVCLFLLKK